MNFTFGITTDGSKDNFIEKIIDSIEVMKIPFYEILIVGNSKVKRHNTTVFDFDETIKPLWITKKKNIITREAKFENVVYLHDYIYFDEKWYEGFLKFNDFKVCMNKILNLDGTRYIDWVLWFGDSQWPCKIENLGFNCLLPYEVENLSEHMYVPGFYWIAKKEVMINFPLNEDLCWGQGEDVEWSFRIREVYDFSINRNSTVKLMKQKDVIFSYTIDSQIKDL